MSEVSGQIRGLEQVGGFGGKAVTLAEGQTYAHDSDFYKKTLAQYAAITPAAVRTSDAAMAPPSRADVVLSPGERDAYAETKVQTAPRDAAADAAPPAKPTRALPAVGAALGARFPGDHSHDARERHPARICAARRRSDDPAGAGVQRGRGVRRARIRAACPPLP